MQRRCYLFATVLICLSFSPYVFYDFGFHNDFEIWSYDNKVCCSGFPETPHLIRIGRFLQAFLQNVYLSFFTDLKSLVFGRALGIVFACIAALMLSSLARRNGMGKFSAAAFGASAFLLPPAQVNLGWLTNFIPGLFNAVVVLGAAFLLPQWQAVLARDKRACLQLATCSVLLLASLFIYPPTSGFFLFPVMIRILFVGSSKRSERLQALYSLAFFGFICASYFLFHRFVFMRLFHIAFEPSAFYRFDISRALFDNLARFFYRIFPVMLNLWNPAPFPAFAVCILFVILFPAVLWAKRQRTFSVRTFVFPIVFLSFCFLAINASGLLAIGRPPVFYRAWHPGTAVVLLLLFWSFEFPPLAAAKKWVLCTVLLVGVLFSFDSSFYIAKTLSRQFEYAVEQVREQYKPNKKRYLIVEMRPESLLLGHIRWGELGFLHFLSGGHVTYILKKYFGVNEKPVIDSLFATQKENLFLIEPELLGKQMDSNALKPPKSMPDTVVRVAGTVTTSAVSDSHFSIQRALDGIYYTFWETATRLPIEANFKFLEKRQIRCYALQAGIDGVPERVPRAWELLGSDNGRDWNLLDSRRDETGWADSSRRNYLVASPNLYQFYRLKFLALNGAGHLRLYELAFSEDNECVHTIP